MKTILFIDDEKNILNALKRVFRNLEFECYYAQNIGEAVSVLMSVQSIDMLVTDIKMPYFDGIRVLKFFKEASPATIRVALSGYASASSITEAVSKNLAKQYFYKPWDNQSFIDNIRKMFLLEDKLKAVKLFEAIQKFEGIKTIPRLFNEINLAIQHDKNVEDIATLVKRDPAIAANILRIANSAFYAARTGDLQQAIMYIGLNNLKQVVLSYELSNMKDALYEKCAFIWKHSTRTNLILNDLYERHYNKKIPAMISSAGLVHDIGKIIMLQIFGNSYYSEILASGIRDDDLTQKENAIFGIDHGLLGGYFLNWWAFPVDIIESTMYHHDPMNESIANRELVAMVCVASQIESMETQKFNTNYLDALDILKLSDHQINDIEAKYRED